MLVVFVSGPYSTGGGTVAENIAKGRQAARELWAMGHAAICPMTNTAYFPQDTQGEYDNYLNGYLLILSRCDAALFLPGWEQSTGASAEHAQAVAQRQSITYYPELPPVDTEGATP